MFLQQVHFLENPVGISLLPYTQCLVHIPAIPFSPISGCSRLCQWPASTVVTLHNLPSPQTPDLSTCLSITFLAICSPSAHPPSHRPLRRHPYFKMCVSGYLVSWGVSMLPNAASARMPLRLTDTGVHQGFHSQQFNSSPSVQETPCVAQ